MEFVSYDVKKKGPFKLMPLGDIQWTGFKGSTALELLRRRIDYGLEQDAMFLGLGDYIDFMSPSNRARLAAASLYDNAKDVIEAAALDLTYELFEKILKPTKGRWLGLLEGHHMSELQDGTTTDQLLAELLGTAFLGTTVMGRIRFPAQGDVTFWATHGQGGGGRAAAPLTKLETMSNYWDANLFLIGHMTKLATAPIERVYASWYGQVPHLQHRKIMLVGCGGFSKGYVEHSKQGKVPRGTYVEQKMLVPTSLGNPLIRVTPVFVNRDTGGVKHRVWEPDVTVEL